LYSPSKENIMDMFVGTSFEELVPTILEYIDKKGYITRNPDGLFLVSYSVLPEKEVSEEKKDLMKEYENVTKIIGQYSEREYIQSVDIACLREVRFKFIPQKSRIMN